MNTGQVISGVAHVGLITFAIFGGAFQAEPLPFRVTEVTAISAEEYAALIAPDAAPDAVANVDTPEPPQEGESAPNVSSEPDTAPEQETPDVSEAPPPDQVPEVTETPPEAEVSDDPPVLDTPQEEVAVLVPDRAEEARAEEAPRVAPEPVAQPEPDVAIDDIERDEVAPDAEAEETVPDDEATAPEEATTKIVTEADQQAAAAPVRSLRPQTRPNRPEPAAEPEETPDTTPQTETAQTEDDPETSGSVNDALAEALGTNEGPEDTAPQGRPLTRGERDGLRVAVQQCWNVGSLSSDALATTVVLLVELGRDGKPLDGGISLLESKGGSGSSVEQAFGAARRAVLRCGARGFDLPADNYDRWKEIELEFDPAKLRRK